MHVFLSSHKESKLKVLLLALGLMGSLENLIALGPRGHGSAKLSKD